MTAAHPDWVRAEGIRADRLIRARPDGWHLVVERLPSGVWVAAAHRGGPDDWASLGRHPSEAAALAAADGWEPTAPRLPLRLRAPEPEPPAEPEPDDEAPEPTTPTTTDPRQLSLWSRP
jgi:hypothetical protein